MRQDEWIEIGIKMGYCSPPICDPHDGMPMSQEEAEQYEEGEDPCIHVLRLYFNDQHRKEVEEFSPQAVWRKAGWE